MKMICDTIRKGSECAFMSASGCSYNGGTCLEVLESCNGCNRTAKYEAGWFCTSCPDPSIKWKNGNCNLATHIQTVAEAKAKVNPLKASKRGGGGGGRK